jgi:hygromycin-B 4-O-kinase
VLEIGRAPGGFYAVSERRFGGLLEDADEAQLVALLPSLIRLLDAIRQADISGSSGYGLWGADGDAPYPSWRATLLDVATDRTTQREHGWRQRLAASPTGDGPFLEAYERLASLADALPDDRHLIHSDLLHGNVLVEGDRITAVLDWGSAMYGDFLYDLAWITFWSAWYPAWRAIDFRTAAARHFEAVGLDVPRFEERLRACELHVGLSGQAYHAFRGFWDDLAWTAARTLELARGAEG